MSTSLYRSRRSRFGDTTNEPSVNWNPISSPSDNEAESIYYTENAVFRTAILWDMLAQLYNIKAEKGRPIEKVYAKQLFHDAQQGKRADPFAQKIWRVSNQVDTQILVIR